MSGEGVGYALKERKVLVLTRMHAWSWSSVVGDKTYREEAEADGSYELAGGYCG